MKRFDIPLRCSSAAVRAAASEADGEFTLVYTRPTALSWVEWGLDRLAEVARSTGAAMAYADHFNDGAPAPVIDWQLGAVRDDFDFGGVQLWRTSVLKQVASQMTDDYEFAGLYDAWLRASELGPLVHVPEFLYYESDTDKRDSDVKAFDYVNPSARAVQIEMEQACTSHLKRIGGWLAPEFKEPDLSQGEFEYEASVVIPCKNRVKTVGDAIRSALDQKTSFPYNVIVVDDNSTDGTVDVIKSFLGNPRLIYIPQPAGWHAIGGNWNAALHHPKCGRFALQLDSDDLYSDDGVVERFVRAFYEQKCAMVIGCYRLTDFNLNELPPGIIEHREWTDENGRNNALRINGLGAPRGFWTPLLRQIGFPPTKYGEDYAVGLRVSREYRIGRIWNVMYNCRRWGGNSDSSLDVDSVNRNNFYKDHIRTWELSARIAVGREK